MITPEDARLYGELSWRYLRGELLSEEEQITKNRLRVMLSEAGILANPDGAPDEIKRALRGSKALPRPKRICDESLVPPTPIPSVGRGSSFVTGWRGVFLMWKGFFVSLIQLLGVLAGAVALASPAMLLSWFYFPGIFTEVAAVSFSLGLAAVVLSCLAYFGGVVEESRLNPDGSRRPPPLEMKPPPSPVPPLKPDPIP